MQLSDSVTTIPQIGNIKTNLLENMGVFTLKDLLWYAPYKYVDSSNIATIAELSAFSKKTVLVSLNNLKSIRLRSGKTLQKALITDDSGTIEVSWFNQPFLVKNFAGAEKIYLSGKLNPKMTKPQLVSPTYDILKDSTSKPLHLGRIVPEYQLTNGITKKWFRSKLKWLVDFVSKIEDISDLVSRDIEKENRLVNIKIAFKNLHFPETVSDLIDARKRLGLSELLDIQKKLFNERLQRRSVRTSKIEINAKVINEVEQSLPFRLSKSQKNAIQTVFQDISKTMPMKRLIQGDVGSGKTMVAIFASLAVALNNHQVIVLAPTTILAEQLYTNFQKYLPTNISIELFTASRKRVTTSKVDILIGTHAILHHKKNLIRDPGIIIIDEQHRFGVSQRRELLSLEEDFQVHQLQMTATPIPRTLAQSLFGDLDVSIIENRENHSEISTKIVPESKTNDLYNWLETKIISGEQAFWVFPLIESSENEEQDTVMAAYKRLTKQFPEIDISFLHGKLKNEEKTKIINEFRQNKSKILISTTVIEVGIDIPNASIIIIEGAEHYGLAQLHQLRGRVGRAGQEAWCFIRSSLLENANIYSRLHFFASTLDGIKVAEFDLENRGPGEVYGTKQSGIPNLKVARFSNLALLKLSEKIAKQLFTQELKVI